MFHVVISANRRSRNTNPLNVNNLDVEKNELFARSRWEYGVGEDSKDF